MSGNFDLCVIGAGPGGYVAAIRAGQLGAKVVVIEKDYLGGTCLNWGCIPTKTLIAGVEVLDKIKNAGEFGIRIEGKVVPEWPAMLKRKNVVVEKLRGGIAALLKSADVTVLDGTASFVDPKTVLYTGNDGEQRTVSAEKIIIASGAEPLMPHFIPKSKRVLNSTQLLSIPEVPKTLLILGGGVIGCEFACLFAKLGAEVIIVEMLSAILPAQDKEISRLLTREMEKLGIRIITGCPLEKIKADNKAITGIAGKERVSAEYMLAAIGRSSATGILNLKAAGVETDEKGWIPVDSQCRTNMLNIYAIGDVTGRIQLAHLATAMAYCAAENVCGGWREFRDDLVPNCIFTAPEIGTIGLTREQCGEQGVEIKTGKFPFTALGKAMTINETTGFCKVIASAETDQVLGVHIIGPHATDIIAEAVPAMNLEITAKELGRAIHAHPTLSEIIMETAHTVHGESVHIPTQSGLRIRL